MKTSIYFHKPQPESLYCLNFLHARCYHKESKRSLSKNTEKKKSSITHTTAGWNKIRLIPMSL